MTNDWRLKHSLANRRQFIALLLLAAVIIIVGRSIYLQVLDRPFLQNQGDARAIRDIKVAAPRGMIVDRMGQSLAISSPVKSLCGDPRLLAKNPEHIRYLASLPELANKRLPQRIKALVAAEKPSRFIYLARQLEPTQAQHLLKQIRRENIKGVWLLDEYRRYYPETEISAQVVGFTNIDDIGQEGLELAFNNHLQGMPGAMKAVLGGSKKRQVVEVISEQRKAKPGKKIQLSLDKRIQYVAYSRLKAALERHQASAAMAVVLDVTTGEILAMANLPAINPNEWAQRRNKAALRNRTVTDVLEPGSTLKPFAVAVALEQGVVSPTTKVRTQPGWMKLGRYTVEDIRNYGTLDVTDIIVKSSNVGISKIAQQLNAEDVWRLYHALGFGQSTGLIFSAIGEQAGVLRPLQQWNKLTWITQAYGYGVSVTALQLAQAYAVLAADGLKRPLSILRREEIPVQGVQRVLSEHTSRTVRAMLEEVVKRGSGTAAAIPGYRVAGKTGTVRKIINGRYSEDRYYSLFAGMAPASEPRLVTVVVVDESTRGHYFGGRVAAPIFREIMTDALHLLAVPADDVPQQVAQLNSQEGR